MKNRRLLVEDYQCSHKFLYWGIILDAAGEDLVRDPIVSQHKTKRTAAGREMCAISGSFLWSSLVYIVISESTFGV